MNDVKYLFYQFNWFRNFSFIHTHTHNTYMYQMIPTLYSFQFSSAVSHVRCLKPHRLQHARFPCPSPTSGPYSNLCPLSWWCHPSISSSVVLFSSCLQSFPASGSFPTSQFFASGGQRFGVSASASFPPKNDGLISFRMDWLDLLAVQGTLSRVFSNTTVQNINSLVFSLLYGPTLTSIHDHWKNHSFDKTDLCQLSNVSAV